MQFTVYISPQTPGPEPNAAMMEAVVENAFRADEVNFSGAPLTHHHSSNYYTYCDSFMFGAYLAAHIKKACLLLQVTLAQLMNPLELVENCSYRA